VNQPTLTFDEYEGDVGHALHSYLASLRSTGGEQIAALMGSGAGHRPGAALYRAPPFQVSVPALPVPRLSINLTQTRVGAWVQGDVMRSYEARRHAVFLTPADVPMVFRKDVPSRHINIYFQPDSFGDLGLASTLSVSAPLINLSVPGMGPLVDELVDELQGPSLFNADAADCLSRLVLVQLARHLRHARPLADSLSAATLVRLREYVLANLGQRVLVADLARQAGLSPDRFALAFKAQTLQTPHQFVMTLRVEHAAELLRNSTVSLAEVAHHCGFASQQHLTNVLRSQLGMTPGRYRVAKHSQATA
jgi:AraC-like DNA-binding protein